jgi:hypothetical protein
MALEGASGFRGAACLPHRSREKVREQRCWRSSASASLGAMKTFLTVAMHGGMAVHGGGSWEVGGGGGDMQLAPGNDRDGDVDGGSDDGLGGDGRGDGSDGDGN